MYHYCVIFAFLLHFSSSESTTKDIRLEGGKLPTEGRVEIWFNGKWRTICDNNWGFNEASVVCRQLDLGLFGWAEVEAIYGEASGPIWDGSISCNGSEKSIMECKTPISVGEKRSRCGHSQDVGVMCTSDIKLNGGKSSKEGNLKIYSEKKKKWECIPDDYLLGQDIVTTICRKLKLGMEGTLVSVNESSNDVGSGMEYEFLDSPQDILPDTTHNQPVISCFGDIDECLINNPCSPNGICIHKGNQPSCVCQSGFTGSRCEKDSIDTREMQANLMVLKVIIPLVFLVAALALVYVVLHHRQRKRNPSSMVLDNSISLTTTYSRKGDYLQLSEK